MVEIHISLKYIEFIIGAVILLFLVLSGRRLFMDNQFLKKHIINLIKLDRHKFFRRNVNGSFSGTTRQKLTKG